MADKKPHTITLSIAGATENLPASMRAYGVDCAGGKGKDAGHYAYVAIPGKGEALLIHEMPADNGGKLFHAWKSSKAKDVPPENVALHKAAPLSAAAAQKALGGMVARAEAAQKFGGGPLAQTVLRGSWKGYIACKPSGAQIVLLHLSNDRQIKRCQ